MLVCANLASDDESEEVFLEVIKVSVKIYSHRVQIIVVQVIFNVQFEVG